MNTYAITTGRHRYDKEWKVQRVSWGDLVSRLSKPIRTRETMQEYLNAPKAEKLKLKDVGGFVGGEQINGGGERKNSTLKSRSVLSIDLDGDARSKEFPDPASIKERTSALLCSAVIHSTHSSTPERPRLRIIIPLSREVSADEYAPIALRIAERLGMQFVDQTCRQAARLMFWPSIPQDAPYIFEELRGEPLDADKVLGTYMDWRDASEYPGTTEALRAAALRKHLRGDITTGRATDPALKDGIVGAFCACYDIEGAINAFGLPYKRCGASRYTYTGGSSVGGAAVYDGVFLFSNHATDPCSLQCCNAFDLVRIHLYGDRDYAQKEDTPVNRLNSFVAMQALIDDKLPHVKAALLKRTQKHIESTFAGIDPLEDDKPAKTKKNGYCWDDIAPSQEAAPSEADEAVEQASEDPSSWLEEMLAQMETKSGRPLPTPANYATILSTDPRLKGRLRFDEFARRKQVTSALPWDKDDTHFPREWSDADTSQLSIWLSHTYRLNTGRQAMLDAVEVTLGRNRVHPVREWLRNLPKWDGNERLDTLFIRYLGAPNNLITRAMTRKHLTAAVARVFEPGIKYDQVLCFCGGEGIGKSTIIRKLANGWVMDSDISVGDKDAYQNLVGHWLIEMSEFADMETKSVAQYKSFISSSVDSYRPSYARETIAVPRQCVFFGTTNEESFLKGRTGNRRFWVLDCSGVENGADRINKELPEELEQVWAEALHHYHAHEPLYLNATEEAALKLTQRKHEDLLNDSNVEIIREFVLAKKPYNWEALSIQDKRDWYHGKRNPINTGAWGVEIAETYESQYISVKEIAMVVFGQVPGAKSRFEDKSLSYICNNIDCLRKTEERLRWGKEIGRQRVYKVVRDDDDLPA